MDSHTYQYEKILNCVRNGFESRKTRPISFRLQQLSNFSRLLTDGLPEILDALKKDMKKSNLEACLYEIEMIHMEIDTIVSKLKEFAAPDYLPVNLLAVLDKGRIQQEPYGVVLILGAWNYPFLLTLQPVIGAIGAGNSVIIKPSELSPHSSATMARLVAKYLDSDCYQVIQGDREATKKLLEYKFDYIFCTGSSATGRSVMAAAAQNLTPVTLELGGKTPCYIDESADFFVASKRILWGKFMNLGQTCVAPDYILCSKNAQAQFTKTAFKVLEEWYGSDLQGNLDMPRIINKFHFKRLKTLLDTTKGTVVFGGKTDEDDLWIEPTIVVDVQDDDSLMAGEIFGPIIPIITVNSVDEAIAFIQKRSKPLAVYTFSNDESKNTKFINNTSSGSACINDVVGNAFWPGLPFGGVGDSGMGSYHGEYSLKTFSQSRPILHRSFSALSEKIGEARYPPYTKNKIKFMSFLIRNVTWFNVRKDLFSHIIAAFLGAFVFYILSL